MVQLVFVHGVNTRQAADDLFPSAGGLTYAQSVASREQFFQEHTFPGKPVTFYNPYWGQFGAKPEGRFACIPKFLPPSPQRATVSAQAATAFIVPQTILLNHARINLAAAVQTLSVQSTLRYPDPSAVDALQQRSFWRAAAAYAIDHPHPDWLGAVSTDDQFLAKLHSEVSPAPEVSAQDLTLPSFDVLGWLKALGADAAKKAIDQASTPITDYVRKDLSAHIGIFEGDIFHYLRSAPPRAAIRDIIHADLVKASAAKDKEKAESLVVVSHSMGGPIVYDMLTDPDEAKLLHQEAPEFSIDLWISVGSQVGIFEETKSYVTDTRSPPTYPLKRPSNVRQWLNYYNNVDVLSFLTSPIWGSDVVDVMVDTFSGVTEAHGAYFTGAVFYEDLRRRVERLGIS